MRKKRRAFTLAEAMIGIMVFSLLGLAISKLMTGTQRQAAIGRCKNMLRQDLKMVTMYLQRDIESSRVVYDKEKKQYKSTLDPDNPISKIETPKRKNGDSAGTEEDISYFDAVENEDDDPELKEYDVVSYSIADGVLTRSSSGGSHKIANHVKSIEKTEGGNEDNGGISYNGKLELTITLEANIEGFGGEPLVLEEPIVISIRQLQNKINFGDDKKDNKWKRRIGKNDY